MEDILGMDSKKCWFTGILARIKYVYLMILYRVELQLRISRV